MIVDRLLNPNDSDVDTILDQLHTLATLNVKPWWACDNPPYPSRSALDAMLRGVGEFVILTEDTTGEILAWNYFDSEGSILAGVSKNHPSHNGYRVDMDQWAIDLQAQMSAVIIAQTGKVQHMAVRNARMWYALEVQCHIPRDPKFDALGPPPTEPPPLPEVV